MQLKWPKNTLMDKFWGFCFFWKLIGLNFRTPFPALTFLIGLFLPHFSWQDNRWPIFAAFSTSHFCKISFGSDVGQMTFRFVLPAIWNTVEFFSTSWAPIKALWSQYLLLPEVFGQCITRIRSGRCQYIFHSKTLCKQTVFVFLGNWKICLASKLLN